MSNIDMIRAAAREHQDELSALMLDGWTTPQRLAKRWEVSVTTVKSIPADELPYKEFGNGLKLKRRRYRMSDVNAYEATGVRGARHASEDAA